MKRTPIRLYQLMLLCVICWIPSFLWAQETSNFLKLPEVIFSNVTNRTVSLGFTYNQPLGINKEAYYSLDGGRNWTSVSNTPYLNIGTGSSTLIQPAIATFSDGSFLIVWKGSTGLVAQKFTTTGEAAAGIFDISSNAGTYPQLQVATLLDGGFVVAWSTAQIAWGEIAWNTASWGSGSPGSIYAQHYDASGTPVGAEFQVNTYDSNWQSLPTITGLTDGGFVISWVSYLQDGSEGGIYAQRYDASGTPVGTEFQVNSYTNGNQTTPKIADLNDGGFLITWAGDNGGDSYNIYAQRYDADGYSVGQEFQINSASSKSTLYPTIISLTNGYTIIAWRHWETQETGTGQGIHAQQYDEYLLPLGDTFQIYSGITIPSAMAMPEGGFLYSWVDYLTSSVNAKRYNDVTTSFTEPIMDIPLLNSAQATAFPDGGFALVTSDSNQLSQAGLFPGKNQVIAENVSLIGDVQVQFKLVDPQTSQEWLSPIRSYTSSDGENGSILYDDMYTNQTTALIGIDLPDGGYHSLQLYQRIAALANDTCDTFSTWTPHESQTVTTTEVEVPLEDTTCYQFKWEVTNVFGTVYEYTSDNVIKADRVPPVLDFTHLVAWNKLELNFNISDPHSGVYTTSFQLNEDEPVLFSGNILTLFLENGENQVQLEVIDQAGNSASHTLSATGGLPPPEVIVYGIEEGGTYGDNVALGYILTQSLTDFLIFVDEEPVSDITFLIDGVSSTELSGVEEGEHTVIVQGNDAQGNPVSTTLHFSDGLMQIETAALADGAHTLTIQGSDVQGTLIQNVTNFTLDRSFFSLSLISPQERTYEENSIRIQYQSSESLQRVWYQLNGGADQENLELNNLVDGNYEIVFYAESEGGEIKSVTRTFTVFQTLPTLEITGPEEGRVYPGNTIQITFTSNGAVTYQVADQGREITSGEYITLPEDGAYTITLTATHPVSGYIYRESIFFETDSVVPEVEIHSPQPIVYNYNDIPIDYTTNKPLQNTILTLDGAEITELSGLNPGVHTFHYSAEDHSDRFAIADVDFTVVNLDIIAPADDAILISNTTPPEISMQYVAEGPFTFRSVSIDDGEPQVLNGSSGTVTLQTLAGEHELIVRGSVGGTVVGKSINFRIGAKNITTSSNSISYTYTNCDALLVCDVTVTLTVNNTGDYDIEEPFQVRFDHISPSGFETQWRQVDALATGEAMYLTLDSFSSSYGSTFLVSIDPNGDLDAENTADNSYQTSFLPGQINGAVSLLRDSNIYLQGVTAFNVIATATSGAVDYVEFHTNGITFVDEVPEAITDPGSGITVGNSFSSLVDVGLLTAENNCVQILAYNTSGDLQDSRNHCFSVKRLNMDRVTNYLFPWSQFFSSHNRVITSSLDFNAIQQARVNAVKNTVNQYRSLVSVVELTTQRPTPDFYRTLSYEDLIYTPQGKITYEMIASVGDERYNTIKVDTGPYPLFETSDFPSANGKVMVSIDPRKGTCVMRSYAPSIGTNHEYLLLGQKSYLEIYRELITTSEQYMNGFAPIGGTFLDLAKKAVTRGVLNSLLNREDRGYYPSLRSGVAEFAGGYCYLSISSQAIDVALEGRFDLTGRDYRDEVYHWSIAYLRHGPIRDRITFSYDVNVHYRVMMSMSARDFEVSGNADFWSTYEKGPVQISSRSNKKNDKQYRTFAETRGGQEANMTLWGATGASSYFRYDVKAERRTKDQCRWGPGCSWSNWHSYDPGSYRFPSGGGYAEWP